MVLLEIVVVVLVCAGLTRLIRLSDAAAPLRDAAAARSDLLAKLLACPHCLSFWLAAACALLRWWVKGLSLEESLLELGLFVLLGWRGAYYINRQIDLRVARQSPVGGARSQRRCSVCAKPYSADFLERQGMEFCSVACWFDYLKERPRPRQQTLSPSGEFIRQEITVVQDKV
jgi:hypothetical protein